MADAVRLVQSAITLRKVAKANKPEESQKERAEAKRNWIDSKKQFLEGD